MKTQIPLPIPLKVAITLDGFIPGNNSQILQALIDLPGSKEPQQLLIAGPAGVGKTHLLLGLCAAAEKHQLRSTYIPMKEHLSLAPEMLQGLENMNLVIFDDIQQIAGNNQWELEVFGLFNRAKDRGVHLVFSANAGATALPIQLPDLKSRLAWGINYQLQALNDNDKITFLVQQASQRGLALEVTAAEYLLARCTRDTGSLIRTFNDLDRASMETKRRLTIPFIREQLKMLAEKNPPNKHLLHYD